MSSATLIERIRRSVIGDDTVLDGPFGPRRLTYADYTASGRSLSFVEDFIRDRVLPLYANTHTEASATGFQTTALREQARHIVHRAVKGGEDDVVIFCGSGATGAIDRLARVLGLGQPAGAEPLPHREATGGVRRAVRAPLERAAVAGIGRRRGDDHRGRRRAYRSRPPRGGAPALRATPAEGRQLLRRLERDRNRDRRRGGRDRPASPRRALVLGLRRRGSVSPDRHEPGAGPLRTGTWPTRTRCSSRRTSSWAAPARRGSWSPSATSSRTRSPRCRAAGRSASCVPRASPTTRSPRFARRAARPRSWSRSAPGWCSRSRRRSAARRSAGGRPASSAARSDPGRRTRRSRSSASTEAERLAIVSLGLRHERGLLHSNFVVAVLSDLFGIQARSGCFCAGPYLHRTYPIDDLWSARMNTEAARGNNGAKLALVRLGFNYFISEAVFEYIVEAVHLLANEGWKLLPLYRFDPASGVWRHRSAPPRQLVDLEDIVSAAAGSRPVPQAAERARGCAVAALPRRGTADHPAGGRRAGRRPRPHAGLRAGPLVSAAQRGNDPIPGGVGRRSMSSAIRTLSALVVATLTLFGLHGH